jgi:hypothetical protein
MLEPFIINNPVLISGVKFSSGYFRMSNIAHSNEIVGWEGVGQLLCFFKV